MVAMKCLPSSFFRRARPGLPSPVSPALTPQHPKAKLKSVNDIIRKSFSKTKGRKIHEDGSASFVGSFVSNVTTDECVADSLSDITRENEWFLLHVEQRLPSPRSHHAAVANGPNLYVLGGESVDGILGDVQVFNIDQFSWKELYSDASDAVNNTPHEPRRPKKGGPRFIPRGPRLSAPFAGMWKGQLIVVGCFASAPKDAPLTVHAFDPVQGTWSALNPKGKFPEARIGYRIVQVKSLLVMFGGEDASGRMVDDVLVLDLEKMTWTSIQTKGVKPAPRKYHAMACYDGRYIWIYGGKSYSTYYNDIYCLDIKQHLWTLVEPRGAVPTMSRAGHVGIIRGDSFYIIGGEKRGEEMVDTLAFDIQERSWSVVASVHAMSPLAHNGLSVLKVNRGGKQYLVAFGGHGMLLSCQMYALLLPSTDQSSEPDSFSSSESLRLNTIFKRSESSRLSSISKCSTLHQEKTSPTDPFQLHRTASLSSSSWESDVGLPPADTGPELGVAESPSRKERPRSKTMSGYINFDLSAASGELYQPSRLSNASRHDQSGFPPWIGQCEEDFITMEKNDQIGRSNNKLCDKDGGWGLKTREAKDRSRWHCDSPIADTNNLGSKTPGKTDSISKQLLVIVEAIKELKDDDLNMALLTIKDLQEESSRAKEEQRGSRKKVDEIEEVYD